MSDPDPPNPVVGEQVVTTNYTYSDIPGTPIVDVCQLKKIVRSHNGEYIETRLQINMNSPYYLSIDADYNDMTNVINALIYIRDNLPQ